MEVEHYIKILEERKQEAQQRVANSDAYKEYKLLKTMIEDLRREKVPEKPTKYAVAEPLLTLAIPMAPAARKKSSRGGYSKDMDKSPVPHIRFGQRINYVYELIENIVKDNKGQVSIAELNEHLKEHYNELWENLLNTTKKTGVIAAYIQMYNKHNEDNQRLSLVAKSFGQGGRANRWTKIIYNGKERLV